MHSSKDLDLVIQLIIYYAINVKYSLQRHPQSLFFWVYLDYFPFEWREWWFDDIVLLFPVYYNSISITEPQSVFMDRIKDFKTWNEGIKYQNWVLFPMFVIICFYQIFSVPGDSRSIFMKSICWSGNCYTMFYSKIQPFYCWCIKII